MSPHFTLPFPLIKPFSSYDKLAGRTLLSPRQILDLLDFLTGTTYFKFNGDFYQKKNKTDGAAMGGGGGVQRQPLFQNC